MTGVETDLMMFIWCSTMRWNYCLMRWGGWPMESLDGFFIDVLCEIPHSCLEYGTRVNRWRDIWLSHSTVRWNVEVLSWVLDFASLMKGYFPLYLYENFDLLYVVYMSVLSRVFYATIMLVMYVFYDSCHVWLSSCSYMIFMVLILKWWVVSLKPRFHVPTPLFATNTPFPSITKPYPLIFYHFPLNPNLPYISF